MNLETMKTTSQDFQTILSKIGRVTGCVKAFNVEDNIASDILNEFSNELKNAKGILIEFEVLPTISLLAMNKFTSFINEFMGYIIENANGEIIFGTTTNENMQENTVKCKILFTGLV